MNSDREFVLQVRNLSKAFAGAKALDNVCLDVKSGEVHGLMGENGAGKSTLMNILIGMLDPDAGEVIFQGEVLNYADVKGTLEKGISMVHQEILPVPELTVGQNIYLGKETMRGSFGWIDEQSINEQATEQLRELGVDINVDRRMKDLSVAEMQMVEIAKALSNDANIIIMDEPTASLSEREVENLFRIIDRQKKKGVTVIYISHRMEEIFKICDTVTVLRDGQYIGSNPVSQLTQNKLIEMMVGRKLETVFPEVHSDIGKSIFSGRGLTRDKSFYDVNFEIRQGEILGIAGLMGAGRSEIFKSIIGLNPLDSGEVYFDGEKVKIDSPKEAIQLGLSYVSEDRKGLGLIQELSVKQNVTLSSLKKHVDGILIREKSENTAADQMVRDLQIKGSGIDQKVKFLSGGNQQKVVIGKALLASPNVLILDEPTRGIDVGAKFEIYQLITQLAKQGIAIILISSELPELLGLGHRILVLSKGRITAELTREEATQKAIMQYAMQN